MSKRNKKSLENKAKNIVPNKELKKTSAGVGLDGALHVGPRELVGGLRGDLIKEKEKGLIPHPKSIIDFGFFVMLHILSYNSS